MALSRRPSDAAAPTITGAFWLALRLNPEMAESLRCRAPPVIHSGSELQRKGQALLQALQQHFVAEHFAQVAHPRLAVAGEVEEQLQQGFHQQRHLLGADGGKGGAIRLVAWRTTGQAEGEQRCCVVRHRRQPEIVGVLQHCQGFATVELDAELGRQAMEARGALQQVEQLAGQRSSVESRGGVEAQRRADQQIAHIIRRQFTRAEAGAQQFMAQRIFSASMHAANLQIGAVGRFQHAIGMALGGLGNGSRSVGVELPTGQLDAADAAIAGGHDAQQAGAGMRADGQSGCVLH